MSAPSLLQTTPANKTFHTPPDQRDPPLTPPSWGTRDATPPCPRCSSNAFGSTSPPSEAADLVGTASNQHINISATRRLEEIAARPTPELAQTEVSSQDPSAQPPASEKYTNYLRMALLGLKLGTPPCCYLRRVRAVRFDLLSDLNPPHARKRGIYPRNISRINTGAAGLNVFAAGARRPQRPVSTSATSALLVELPR